MPAKQNASQLRKDKVWTTVQKCAEKYTKCLFVNVDNVTSKQICIMRKELRAKNAVMVMGKNTLLKRALAELNEKKPNERYVKISSQLVLNTGLIFTNGDLTEIKAILDSQVREAPARIGAMAPCDVVIPAGPTGLDPKQTSFFQALAIQTKIVKSQVEIVNPVKVITEGEKISPGQSALLDKLKIRPFEYKMHIKNFLDGVKVYDAKVLLISEEVVLERFNACAQNVTALSLGTGYVITSATPHLLLNAFKNLAAASFASGFSFKQAEALKSAAASAPKAGGAGGAKAAAVAEKAEEPEVEEEQDVDMGDLFGDDY